MREKKRIAIAILVVVFLLIMISAMVYVLDSKGYFQPLDVEIQGGKTSLNQTIKVITEDTPQAHQKIAEYRQAEISRHKEIEVQPIEQEEPVMQQQERQVLMDTPEPSVQEIPEDIQISDSGERIQVYATSYWGGPGIEGGPTTALGTDVHYGVIAVDPDIIPLGSTVNIYREDGSYMGQFSAEDTGGMIQGNRIDVAFDGPEHPGFDNCNLYVEIVQ